MPYLRNAWYAAAWAREVGQTPFRRTLLDEPVVMFRKRDGEAIALSNICPHRFGPLHLGAVIEDTIECPYHGLRFNTEGFCVFNPDGDGHVPPGARLKRYPLLERYGTLWIWMGQAKADSSKLPDFSFLADDRYRPITGLIGVRANYQFVLDNLLDAAHVAKVHHDTLASPSITRAKSEVELRGNSIWVNRWCPQGELAPIWKMMWAMDRGPADPAQLFDQWVNAGWDAPALVTSDLMVTRAGESMEQGLRTLASHFLTPETESKTHYFWSICRNFKLVDAELDQQIRAGTEYAFVEQDERMLRAIQEQVGGRDFWSLRPMLLHADKGPARVRRTLDEMIAAEAEARPISMAASTA
jgi:phenylpropionate dioxygenase-like ring-hydroxylating dioxygenase large terminal subunit